ncbi:hypothetical protein CRUP_007779, partial [Coryphaenoides rupestris]
VDEIAASTAQLVAASKVKADRNSRKLTVLQQASRTVNEMAANVVASTRTGQENLEEKDTMDFSGMSLIKLKKEEMESQASEGSGAGVSAGERASPVGRVAEKALWDSGAAVQQLPEDNGVHSATASPSHAGSSSPKLPQATKPGVLRKPVLAQKPTLPPKGMVIQVIERRGEGPGSWLDL